MKGHDLVLIEFTVLVLLLSFILESDDDEADEDVDHEEGNDDDVDEEEDCNALSIIVNWTGVFLVRIDTSIHQPAQRTHPAYFQLRHAQLK